MEMNWESSGSLVNFCWEEMMHSVEPLQGSCGRCGLLPRISYGAIQIESFQDWELDGRKMLAIE
jgi:hypothetical protein